MGSRSYILSVPLLFLIVQSLRLTSTETVPLAAVTGYRLPGIFALNDGKPFYLDRDPVTGAVSFNAGGSGAQQIPSEPMAAESSPVADAATAADEYDEEEEEDEGDRRPAPAAAGERSRPPGPLKAAPVVEEVEEDEPPPSRPSSAPLPKDQIDRKDTVSSSKASSGGRPNEIQDGGDANPYFHQFLNLNVHEYGDRIPGASNIRDEPYSFGGLNLGSSPLEREYKFPLISSSYANTKVQGAGGNYYYGPKGNDREKSKDKEKYRPAYADNYAPSSTKRPSPSYYHETEDGDEDRYSGRPSSPTSASNPEEEEEEDYHKYAGSSHHQGNRDEGEEGADEEEGEEGGESIDDLVEEVSDYSRPPVPPKRPEAPVRQPPKESSPTTHHNRYQGDEAEEESSQDYDEERPLYYGGGGYGGRPAADKLRPQQTYYYGQPADDEEEEEDPRDAPQRKPNKPLGADQGEEDRPRPSQANEEAEEEEGGEEGETAVKEKPQKIPPKPSLTYLGFSPDFDRDHHAVFGEKVQGSQKIEKPAKESPGYKYGYSGPPPEFSLDGFYASDLEGPQKKPAREPGYVESIPEDEKPQPSNKNEEGTEEEEGEEEEVVRKPYDNRHPYNPPQVVRFSPAQPSQAPTERPLPQQPETTSIPPTNPQQGTQYKPSYQSPYGLEEPFRPIYGPGEDEETPSQPGQNYQQSNKKQEVQPPVKPSSNAPYRPTLSSDTRPSGVHQYDSYYPIRPQNPNLLPPKNKDNLPETTPKEPITSTYKPYYDSKTKKPLDQGSPSWKVYPSNNAKGSQPSIQSQDETKDSVILREHVKPTTSNQEIITRRPSTLPPPPPPHREVIGIGSVGEPEYIKPANNKPSYGPFRFPDQDYAPQRPILQPQNGLTFAQRPSINNPVTVQPSLPPPPFGLSPQGPQRPILPPSQNIRPQLLDNHPPPYHPQRPPALGVGPPLSPPPRRWEDRPIHPHPSSRPPSQNFLHRPPPPRLQQDQPLNGPPPPTSGHPYKFVSRKPGQEPVLMASAPNAVFGNGFNPNNKKSPPPNGPKAQAPDPNLPNILPQFRPNAKISYSTIQRENRPYHHLPPPPPPQFGPNQRVSNIPERRIISPFYDHLQPPPPPPNRLQRIQGPEHEIPYGPPQVYSLGPGGSPPVGRRSGQHHQARVGEDSLEGSSENQEDSRKRPQVTTLQMMRNGLMEHQAARHPIVSKEDTGPKLTANPTATIQLKPTVYVTPDEGATSASLSVDSSASEDHPVFVVYPVSDSSARDDGVVVGTRGPQRPLPPSSIAAETEASVLPQRPNSVLSDFPYPLLKPSSTLPTRPSKTDSVIVGPVYSLAAEEGPSDRSKDNTESNIIPYLQDYSPYATRKPTVTQNGQPSTSTEADVSVITTSPLPKTTPPPEKSTTKAPVTIVNAWQPDSEVEVSATMHTGNSRVPVNHRPLIEDKTERSSPSPLNFQAPFHASENIDPSPDSGWSAVGGSSSTDLPAGGSSSISRLDYNTGTDIKDNDGDSSDTSKFDFDNFKPQLFGGFKPIYSLPGEDEDELKFALGTTERQER